MKTRYIISILVLVFFYISCDQKPTTTDDEEAKVEYAKDIKPLEYKAEQFKVYKMVSPPMLNQDLRPQQRSQNGSPNTLELHLKTREVEFGQLENRIMQCRIKSYK